MPTRAHGKHIFLDCSEFFPTSSFDGNDMLELIQKAVEKSDAKEVHAHVERFDGSSSPPGFAAVVLLRLPAGEGARRRTRRPRASLKLPKRLQADFSRHVQALADETSRELNAADIFGAFERAYLPGDADRFVLRDYAETGAAGDRVFVGRLAIDGEERSISGRGNGLISGVFAALADSTGPTLDVVDYSEHAIGHGAGAQAVAYLECRAADGRTVWGVGIDTDIATASVRAVLSAANRA